MDHDRGFDEDRRVIFESDSVAVHLPEWVVIEETVGKRGPFLKSLILPPGAGQVTKGRFSIFVPKVENRSNLPRRARVRIMGSGRNIYAVLTPSIQQPNRALVIVTASTIRVPGDDQEEQIEQLLGNPVWKYEMFRCDYLCRGSYRTWIAIIDDYENSISKQCSCGVREKTIFYSCKTPSGVSK